MWFTRSAAIPGVKLAVWLCLAVSPMLGAGRPGPNPHREARPGDGGLRAVQPGMDAQRPARPRRRRARACLNDSSCVACHNSGGSGGAGPISKNIDILSASGSVVAVVNQVEAQQAGGAASQVPKSHSRTAWPQTRRRCSTRWSRCTQGFVPAGRSSCTSSGCDPNYDSWRACKIPEPKVVNGIPQKPIEGVSMLYSFEEAKKYDVFPLDPRFSERLDPRLPSPVNRRRVGRTTATTSGCRSRSGRNFSLVATPSPPD